MTMNPVRGTADVGAVANAVRSGQTVILGDGPTYVPEVLSDEARKTIPNVQSPRDREILAAAMLIEERRPFKGIENNDHLLARFDELYHYEKDAADEKVKKMLHKMAYAVCERIRSIRIRIEWVDENNRKRYKDIPLTFTKDPLNPNWRDAWLDEYIPLPAVQA